MNESKLHKITTAVALALTVLVLLTTVTSAQSVKVQGIIKGRAGNDMILQTSDAPHLVVVLTDTTDVAQVQGAFKVRNKKMSMAALIPGLPVQVEGTYNAQNQLVASKVRFKGDDLQQAQAIQAGVHETQKEAATNEADLKQQTDALDEQHKKIAANKAAIAANSARFGQMDDYYILDEVTVLFGNGKTKVDPQYVPQLTALCEKAKTYNGYMIQVKGYASSSGSAAVNQKLSDQRAQNVTNIVLQQGHVPLTNMLAPGAMGESRQVPTDKTAEGEGAEPSRCRPHTAEQGNRRH
jgi:outer membrane protein OmpA-like peptidoglycan-associated protein